MNSKFIWTDLSTFDIQAAKQFYARCFGWSYSDLGDGYLSCEASETPAAGLYTMPEMFQNIGMPSFWMSYIQVQDIHQTVRVAVEHGAKVEVEPQAAPGGGLVALIRDPAGAGFTCYQGNDLGGRDQAGNSGRMAWNELHVSDLRKVESFYTEVFGWEIKASESKDRYEIISAAGELIAGIQVSKNEVKGDKEYWGVYFSVASLSSATQTIEKNGGEIVAEQPLGNRPALLAYDSQGAAFYIVESRSSSEVDGAETTKATIKWRALTGLMIVALAIVTEANWIWGLLFLLWVIPDIRRGSTHFIEYVERRKNPVVYWLIISSWVLLSFYLLFEWTTFSA